MKYKAVCFDIDGTLYPRKTLGNYMLRMLLGHPVVSLRYNRMRKLFRNCQSSFGDMGLGNGSFEDRELALYAGLYGMAKARRDLEAYYSALENQFCRLGRQQQTQTTWRRIKDRGIAVAVFSDWPLYGKLEQMGLEDLVDQRLFSGECGYLKPDGRCFVFIAEKLRLDVSEILYVGDSYNKDVVGAHNAGMDAVLVGYRQSGKYPLALEVFGTWHDFDVWITGQMEV